MYVQLKRQHINPFQVIYVMPSIKEIKHLMIRVHGELFSTLKPIFQLKHKQTKLSHYYQSTSKHLSSKLFVFKQSIRRELKTLIYFR